jgi:uncharacterized PurR-regulated membrane protein YhhQ (DUF165 family)
MKTYFKGKTMLDKLFGNLDRQLAYKIMAFHIFIIAFSNYVVQFTFNVFGHPLAWAAFTFPLVVVATDLTVRMLGSMAVVSLSGAPDSVAVRIGLGSGCAYFIATMLDVYVFQYFRERYTQWYIAPLLSSIVSTIIDTYTFFGVAFAGGANEFMAANWHIVATNHIITKIAVSLAVILPAYGVLLSFLQKRVLHLDAANSGN